VFSQDSVFCECPYCGETVEILVDPSVPDQEYVEDCSVCCRPMTLRVRVHGDGGISVTALHEDGG